MEVLEWRATRALDFARGEVKRLVRAGDHKALEWTLRGIKKREKEVGEEERREKAPQSGGVPSEGSARWKGKGREVEEE